MISVVAAGRHRAGALVLPQPPDESETESYAWRSLPYLASALAISAVYVLVAQVFFEVDNRAALPFALYTVLYLIYQAVSIPVNYSGRGFDLDQHTSRITSWRPASHPTVDIFLPICGEPIEVLRNTWTGVFELIQGYPGDAYAFVLDDGPSDRARDLAPSFGFTYVRRPELRQFKKAGNLNYAFRHTASEHIAIFDADFRPRSDFLAQTLPYLDDPQTGIVQSPQFFRVNRRQSWVERAASVTLEVFYRVVQVSRDRFGSALCVGSNAVYRRAALELSDGFTQIPYAEDSHTGLDMRYHGYQLRYVPVPLAAGICPATLDAFMRQQYRWCCGATSLIWTRHMWRVAMPWTARLPYLAGWLWNLTTGLRTLILPLIPITLLAFLPGEIRLRNALLLLPAVITGTVLYPLWHNAPYSPRTWPLAIAVGWAQILAIWDYARGKVMSWQPSRGPKDATRRFWWGVTVWNGGLAAAWLILAGWRILQTGSPRFGIVAAFGLLNALVVGRLIFPGKKAT
ncbi:MAG TPA: cellulose synthase catalytic subunit [Streptosporangiaceae bacterium]|jgi:cellulose synthase (UDP-forming)